MLRNVSLTKHLASAGIFTGFPISPVHPGRCDNTQRRRPQPPASDFHQTQWIPQGHKTSIAGWILSIECLATPVE